MCIFGGSKPLKIKSDEDVNNKAGRKGQYAGRNKLKINLASANTASEGAGVNLPQG